ncbi:hypothetical protein EHS25_003172 [Saitozyma podzolica]|uniref:Major facilitator superfamily (MFS) profile domain-containing protein n=1 Tax=Saitozyma podzolica TaxID=1890683 RepID=A0A427Y869_9TREE|nr:hypothetical protein EHS25_003172 [Saitozyma podzolica]
MSSATLNAMTTPEKVVSPAGSVTADRDVSQTNTVVNGDAEAQPKKSAELSTNPHDDSAAYDHPLAQLGQARKNFLLLIFSIASFVDICNVSGVAVAVAQISTDIGLDLSQIVWIITSYSLTFASVLLFAGRLADLFPAQIIFEAGFLALGIISLVTSFVTSNKFGFLILRGIGGICGAMTIPSAFHLLVHMFPNPKEQQAKLALLGMSGAIGNVLGLVLAGLTMLANYRWFFRLIAIICLVFGITTILLLPLTGSPYKPDGVPRWKRLDLLGVVLMMGTLICFILSLTQGPIDGWSAASFIAPFIITFPLAIGFFFWESRIPPKSAVLPSSVWKITNAIISSLGVMIAFPFWATSQLQYATYFQEVFQWTPIHVAAAILPQGIMGLLIGVLSQFVPQIITKPRISLPIGALLIIVAEILQIFSDGGAGMDYWRYCFPAYLLGSAGAVITYFASAINFITYSPPEMAGVSGAWTQVLAQVGGAVVLAVQAGLEGTDLANWKISSARAFYFQIGWTALLAIQYVVFYKKPGTPEEEHIAARKRIADAGIDEGVIA